MRQWPAVENTVPSPANDPPEDRSPAAMAAALASAAEAGHFDELRGRAARDDETCTPALSDKWAPFFDALGSDGFADLNRRTDNAAAPDPRQRRQLQRLCRRQRPAAPLGAGPVSR
jgi:hypothetical protein